MLQLSHPLVAELLNLSSDPVVLLSHDGQLLQVNHAFCESFGVDIAELTGGDAQQSLLGDDALAAEPAQVTGTAQWRGEITLHLPAGPRCVRVRRQQIMQDEISAWAFIVCQPAADRDVANITSLDALTGLPKQELFVDRLQQAMIAAPRVDKSVAVFIIVIDQLGRIRDGLGTASADQVLLAVAQRLQQTIRRSDTAARLSEERMALAMQITSVEDSVLVAEKIIAAAGRELQVEGQSIKLTVSIGVSIFPDDADQAQQLISQADTAVRHIHKNRGNDYEFYSSNLNNMARQRIEMEQSIRQGLLNNEFVVYYQPKVNLENNAIVGAETLVRWQHPERGLIFPGEFIGLAEETGLIGDIGDYVMVSACRQNSLWQQQGLSPVRISVNVTASQFHDHQLVDKVAAILHETGLQPSWLELEITESTLVGDMQKVIDKLTDFRRMGLHISIDDFGTGYSSLSYLSHFPVTTLKIDRAFVKDMQSDRKLSEITSAIIGLSRGLALEVVAEGAESIEHIELLREKGCDQVQGFFFSRPVPADEFAHMLANGFCQQAEGQV